MMFAPKNLAQAINPWSWVFEPHITGDTSDQQQNQQQSININNYRSGNPQLEQKILREVAGYGKQLSMIHDMLQLFLSVMSDAQKKSLSEEQKQMIEKFEKLCADIDALRQKNLESSLGYENITAFLDKLGQMRTQDVEAYNQIATRLSNFLVESGKNRKAA